MTRLRLLNSKAIEPHGPGAGTGNAELTRFLHCRLLSGVLKAIMAVLVMVPTFAAADDSAGDDPIEDFYITVTATNLYLCGDGFGGLYGCIDEAVSREVKSVVISASNEASIEAVQALVDAVHNTGFEQVGVVTFYEPDT